MKPIYLFSLLFIINSCSKNADPQLPVLDNPRVMMVDMNNAFVRSVVTSSGNATVTARGVCWSSHINLPTLENSRFTVNSGAATSGDSLKGLIYNTRYYIRSYIATGAGTAYSKADSFLTLPSPFSYKQQYGGGYVFYIDSTGGHGLIACKTASWGHEWGPYNACYVNVGTSKKLGSGQANTKMIIAKGGLEWSPTAPTYCDNLVTDGYDDWYLPSYDELVMLRNNLGQQNSLFGIYPGDMYWTSSEVSDSPGSAWLVPLNAIADFSTQSKIQTAPVIPIRAF